MLSNLLVCVNLLSAATLIIKWNLTHPTELHVPCDDVDTRADFRTMDVEGMKTFDFFRYLYWTNSSSCRIVHDFGGFLSIKIRIVEDMLFMDGQKSICMDPQWRPQANNCLVYSFGINYEWSFDEYAEQYGCQVYSFDPSMETGDHDHSTKIHFHQMGLGPRNVDDDDMGWKLRTLESIYDQFKGRHGNLPIDVLKFDIEHDEWVVLPQLIRSGMLKRVKQLVLELHFFDGPYYAHTMRRCIRLLRALEQVGFIRFASRPTLVMYTSAILGKLSFVAFEMSFYNSKFVSTLERDVATNKIH